MHQTRRNNRIVASMAALAVLLVMLLSSFYIARETDHVCSGHADCPICQQIHICESVLKNLSSGGALCACAVIFFRAVRNVSCPKCGRIPVRTLITLKVKLSN